MNIQRMLLLIGVAAIAAGSSGSAVAHSGGGGGDGGSHGGGGFHGGRGFHGGGVHHVGRGFRGGDGSRGLHGAAGDRHGSYGGGYNRGWGGLREGLFFASLPSYCDLYFWDGVPYYYADDVYYEWNGTAGAYETVQPPAGLAARVEAQSPVVTELFVFPKAGQTNEQLASEREECHRQAVGQTGFDPTKSLVVAKAADRSAAKRADYFRADGECLEARNYSVE